MRLPISRYVISALFSLFITTQSTLLSAAISLHNDFSLAASADGFNITFDSSTGLEWLDLDVSVGRTFNDLSGVDGSNEFIGGGDFEGFRYATRLELTGAINGPPLFSVLRHIVAPFLIPSYLILFRDNDT